MNSAAIAPALVAQACKLVIKVGSSLVTAGGRGIDHAAVARWAEEIAALRRAGKEVVLVSSGAIAEGMKRLGWRERPAAMHELQAAAAVGQMGLVQAYEAAFSRFDLHTAQILLTHEDLADRRRYLNARSTLLTLIGLGVIPVINENDTVTTEEIRVGDNDTLGALVTNLIEADVLVLLTDQAGLYSSDPRSNAAATLVRHARAGDPALEIMAGGAASQLARGGMLTKVLAAKRAARSGASTVIADGREEHVLSRLAAGEVLGTQLVAETMTLAARKQWLADQVRTAGRVVARCRRDACAHERRQEPAADRRRRLRRCIRARRSRRLLRSGRSRDRTRPDQLQHERDAAHTAQAVVGNREDPGLRGRAGADPPQQPGASVGARSARRPGSSWRPRGASSKARASRRAPSHRGAHAGSAGDGAGSARARSARDGRRRA